jgi:hypothetical protein
MLAIFGERISSNRSRDHIVETSTAYDEILRGARAYQPKGSDARARRAAALLAAGAWTDAAIALLESEKGAWHLTSLQRDGADWVCTLSRFPRLPRELDEVVYGRDPLLPLAILDAVVESCRRDTATIPSAGPDSFSSHYVTAWTEDVFR